MTETIDEICENATDKEKMAAINHVGKIVTSINDNLDNE